MGTAPEFTTYQTGLLQPQAYRALKSFMNTRLNEHSLTIMERTLLGCVYDNPEGIRTSELAELFSVETSLITNMVNNLEGRGLVCRQEDPLDRRAKRVMLPSTSKRLMDRVDEMLHSEMRQWVEAIDRRNLLTYQTVLIKLASLGK